MKVKTVIEDRFPKEKVDLEQSLFIIVTLLVDTVFNTILPFAWGVYFAKTQNIIFLILFIFNMLFRIKIYKEDDIAHIKIIRG